MEYETINKETPEMEELISGIKEVSKRIREIAQTHCPLFGGEIYLTGRRSANTFSLVLALCRTSGQRHYSLHPNRRENTLSTLRYQQITARELSGIEFLK